MKITKGGRRDTRARMSAMRLTARYQREAMRLLYKWLNRRSQRRSMTWKQFAARQPGWNLPPPRVVATRITPALQPEPRTA